MGTRSPRLGSWFDGKTSWFCCLAAEIFANGTNRDSVALIVVSTESSRRTRWPLNRCTKNPANLGVCYEGADYRVRSAVVRRCLDDPLGDRSTGEDNAPRQEHEEARQQSGAQAQDGQTDEEAEPGLSQVPTDEKGPLKAIF